MPAVRRRQIVTDADGAAVMGLRRARPSGWQAATTLPSVQSSRGAVPTPFGATGLVQLTGALLAEGFDEGAVARLMGGKVFRLMRETLPA